MKTARPRRGPAGLLALARAPGEHERAALGEELAELLAWQQTLERFPRLRAGLDATPFVSLYARGRLFGCFGGTEGDGRERLGRAFLRALEDMRFGGVGEDARGELAAQLSYPVHLADVSRELPELPARFELGAHGLMIAMADGRSSVVLPHVARDARLDARHMFELAVHKARAGASDAPVARLWLFETCDVVARPRTATRPSIGAEDPIDAAEAWLAALVERDGAVRFAVDPRTGARANTGEVMHHGRAAMVIAALGRRGRFAAKTARARKRLEADARAALNGEMIAGWPPEPSVIAGTLALSVLAGARLDGELFAFARVHERALAAAPWHLAQVVTALGPRADARWMAACARDLDRVPWAPWTALAASAHGDAPTFERAANVLVDRMRREGPHEGGADVTPVPQLALTAVAVEALAPSRSAAARRARARGRAFLLRWQMLGERLGAAYDVGAARGAFPISPAFDALRCDVTAHALLALT